MTWPYPTPCMVPPADALIRFDQLVRIGALRDEVLVAPGARLQSSPVLHQPRLSTGAPRCGWDGPVEAMTLDEARRLRHAVDCPRCPDATPAGRA